MGSDTPQAQDGLAEHAASQEIDQCKALLGEIGVVLRGSITEHLVRCGKKGCRCQETPPRLHGPYFDWTRKVRGKTRTVRLTRAQAELCQRWIESGRQLNKIIATWEGVGLEAALKLRDRRAP